MVSSAILLIKGFTVEKHTGTAGTPCHGSHSDPLNEREGKSQWPRQGSPTSVSSRLLLSGQFLGFALYEPLRYWGDNMDMSVDWCS